MNIPTAPHEQPALPQGAAPFQLEITPVGDIEPHLLQWLQAELQAQFPWLRCTIARCFAPRDHWWEAAAARLWVDRVLDSLVEWHAGQDHDPLRHWMLAVTDVDLAAPGRPFAFGEATVGGCCAVISLARFHPRSSDDVAERALMRLRMLKEACHELGHVVGLDHCDRADCVMVPSPDIEAIDRKSSDLCVHCSHLVQEVLQERS